MAKRPSPRPRGQADDTTVAPEAAQRRARRPRTAENPEPRGGRAPDDEFAAVDAGPSEEDIRLRAYQRYLERGGGHGMDFDDWLEAERELRSTKAKV